MASPKSVNLHEASSTSASTPVAQATNAARDMKSASVAPVTSDEDEKAARTVVATLHRPAVHRSPLQHLAKWLGIQLEGAVATNEVSTAKYTIVTFLPVNLFEQFMRVANMYFLLCAVLQLIPKLSPTSWFTTVAPLVFVLLVNAVKEGYDDYNRHRNDNQLNSRVVLRVTEHGEVLTTWRDVVAGDVLKVRHGEEIPADMVLLGTAEQDALCYVETANLDGETNLKIKYAWSDGTDQVTNLHKVADLKQFGETRKIGCEAPNAKLYVFDGYVQSVQDTTKLPLTADNLLLRGCTLRKTSWVVGVAVNVGRDTKIVQNMTKAPRKVTQLEQAMNWLVILQFSVMLVLSIIMAALGQWWQDTLSGQGWYLGETGSYPELPSSFAGWCISLLRFIILFSNFIPISLYVTLEVVKVLQCTLTLNSDREMYHAASDTPFVCRTTTLNEELGQVAYVLSDKTGTLTQNVMGFVWASVDGFLYGKNWSKEVHDKVSSVPAETPHTLCLDQDLVKVAGLVVANRPTPAMNRFLTHLALCNTVVPSKDEQNPTVVHYQASSPDEEALVIGASFLGWRLLNRDMDHVELSINNIQSRYDVLACLEFNSDRKRMSLLVRDPQGTIKLVTKGADSVMLARAAPGQPREEAIRQHLDEMSRKGYRTLVMGERVVSPGEYQQWAAEWNAAQVAMEDRESKIAAAAAAIEKNLELVGATGVEDKLQEGVPECLQDLRKAGIKTWILTGDKVETAISIAHNCKLFSDDMAQLLLTDEELRKEGSSKEALPKLLKALKEKALEARAGKPEDRIQVIAAVPPKPVGLVVDGGALHWCLEEESQEGFLALCKLCVAVVCCRVSPMQKALVTRMVKVKAGAVTLGIGDGANDVGMIRSAHIGVGISGREGRAAVLSSDFSFAQFRYLSRLLLIHGRWSYMRNVEVVQYSFYKNLVNTLTYVYLQCVAGFSAVPIFTTGQISTFNPVFTAFPIVIYAVLEQDLTKAMVLRNPCVYETSRLPTKTSFCKDFIGYMLFGVWHSLVVYFVPMYTLATPPANGLPPSLAGVGSAIFIACCLVVNLKLSMRTHCWTWIHVLVYGLSVALLFPFTYLLGIAWSSWGLAAVADMAGVGTDLFLRPVYWLAAVLLVAPMSLLPDFVWTHFQRKVRPNCVVELQLEQYSERMRLGLDSNHPSGYNPMAVSSLAMEEGVGQGRWVGADAAGTSVTMKRRGPSASRMM